MTKLEQAARQALEALEEMFHSNSTKVAVEKYNTAHNALRESLAEQAEQEPVKIYFNLALRKMWSGTEVQSWIDSLPPLYAVPVRTKDLTDDEIEVIFKSHIGKQYDDFARAVISADREKNNV